MSIYYISIGSNMGERMEYLRQGKDGLEVRGISLKGWSSVYETKPWGKTDQPLFLNAILAVEWKEAPEALLYHLQQIEKEAGRERLIPWGPRTLDLDIIWSPDVMRHTDILCLPHRYFWERPFVLVPLEELLPDFVYQGQDIHERLLALHGYESVIKRADLAWKK